MSIQHRNHALIVWRRNRTLPATTKLILYTLAERMNDSDYCDASLAALAEQAGVGKTSAMKSVSLLREQGIIVTEHNGDVGQRLRHHYQLPAGFNWQENAHRSPTKNYHSNRR
jgi:biotin operon repressor